MNLFILLLSLLTITSLSCAAKSDSPKTDVSIIENEVETAFSSIKGLIDRYFDGKANKMARTFGASLRSIFSGGLSTVVFAASLAVGAITMLSFFESPISPLPVPPLPKPPVGRFPPEHPIWPPPQGPGRIAQESAPRPIFANPFQTWNYNRRHQLPSYPPPPPQHHQPLYSQISYRPYYHLNSNQTSLNDLNSYTNRRKIIDDNNNNDEINRGKNTKSYTMRNGPLITYNSTNKVHFNTPRSLNSNLQNIINKRNDNEQTLVKSMIERNNTEIRNDIKN